jgi:hypothetical protein
MGVHPHKVINKLQIVTTGPPAREHRPPGCIRNEPSLILYGSGWSGCRFYSSPYPKGLAMRVLGAADRGCSGAILVPSPRSAEAEVGKL